MTRRQRLLIGALAAPALCLPTADALGYGFYRYGNGRADFNSRYDLAGNSFPGQALANIYNFGQIDGFTATQLTNMGLTAAQVNTAVASASDAWEQYLNLSINNTTAANGTGGLLRFVSVAGTGASTLGYQHPAPGANNWTELRFGVNGPSAGVPWNPTNFAWTLKHELGHAIGLRDMYPDFAGTPYAEDFVDHPVAGNPNPFHNGNLAPDDGRRDNLMDRYRTTSNDYSLAPQTDIDNDEIAGGAWIWGSPYNQIVTGDLVAAWSGPANSVRRIEEHHGDQAANAGGLGWWDYRGSIKKGGTEKPYIDLHFHGYDVFAASLYDDDGSVPSVTHVDLGEQMHRFIIEEVGWGGNFELFVKSTFTDEALITAYVNGGGRLDRFTQIPVDTGLNFSNGNTWAQVFGPIPEPGTVMLATVGLLSLMRRSRRR